ncbi:MAG: hypothetical protein AB8G05_00755 [Oligoflexales bacterium]
MPRIVKLHLKYRIQKRFRTLQDAALELNISYFKLSRYINGASNLSDKELKSIKKILKDNR